MTQSAVLVAGRYRLDARIGAGAMGVVWRAVDERLGRTVAIKQLVVPPGLDGAEADEAKERIMREGRIAARLHHPNAIAVFDVADHDDRPWLVMEYLQSRSLAEVVAERGQLPPREVAVIGRQLADALTAAHAAGIVHRDVKPGNVLLGDDGTVKLTDFGISHAVDDVTVTRTGVLSGTPAYMAPEVARGARPSTASDVFALGATLYAAVEGEPPFGMHDNALALLHQVAAGAVRPPRQAGPLTALLMRLLRADPAERPTMANVRGMLADVADGRPLGEPITRSAINATAPAWPGASPGRPVSLPTRMGLPTIEPAEPADAEPRRKALLIAVAGLLVLLTTAFGLAALREPNLPVAGPAASSVAAQPPTTKPPTTKPPTTTPAAIDPPSANDLQGAVAEYYELVPDDLENAWQRLGPALQARGFDSYERFWQQIESVQAHVLPADPARMRVRAVVVFRRDGERPLAEVHELALIRSDDGQLLIDGDIRLGATEVPGDNRRNKGNGRGGSGEDDG